MERLIITHFWIVFIAVTLANAFILRFRSGEHIRKNPQLKEGYDILFRGFILYGNLPWVIMGIGNMTGATKSILDFLYPGLLNPIVLMFHASVVLLWILLARWIYFRGGAEMLEQYPGMINGNPSAQLIKLLVLIMLLAGIAGMIMMWITSGGILPPDIH